VDRFGRTSLAWDSLGFEAHGVDTMAHALDDDARFWRPEETPWRT